MSKPEYLKLVKPWTTEPARDLVKTGIFTLKQRRSHSPTDSTRIADFVFLDCPDWVKVIALTPDEQVVLVEQYRHGVDTVTLEVPGGIIDPGETPASAAQRELLEETAYAGDPVELIGSVASNAAIQNNRTHTALVRNAALTAAGQQTDHHEEIGVRLVPLPEIPSLINRGIISHSLVVAAFYHLGLHRGTIR